MLYKKILVPVDGSNSSANALDVAKKLVGDDPDATLYVISVIAAGHIAMELQHPTHHRENNPMLFGNATSYQKLIDETTDEVMTRVQQTIGTTLDDAKCQVKTDAVIASKVADGIVDYAKDNGCELIVMGRRGLSMLRGMLGSVSYGVLHEADIPVLSVK